MVGVVGFVGQEVPGVGQVTGEHNGARDIGGLTGRQVERNGRQCSSLMAWTLMPWPPLVRPMACKEAPLFRHRPNGAP